MSTSPLKLRSGVLASFGVGLPYIIVAVSVLAFRGRIGNTEFYTSGRLARWDTITGWISLGAFVFGMALCWPFVRQMFTASLSRMLLVVCVVLFCVLQFIGVFGFRAVLYAISGGIL